MKKFKIISILLLLGVIGIKAKESDFPILTSPYLGQKPPGMTPEIFAPGIISLEEENHSSPVFSPDGKEVYWATMKSGILYMKMKNGRWTSPSVR